ncbi:MAG: hypothetical protein V3W51_00805 [Candidatus Brocadiales bacterium]
MKKTIFLPFIMIFLSCGTGLADVITLWEGSVFEGELVKTEKDWVMFRIPEGSVGMPDEAVVTIEDREPTADEREKLIRFKTERYDVTIKSDSMTPFEEEVVAETIVLSDKNPDMPNETITKILAEEFNLPTMIVDMILLKALLMSQ